VRTLLRAQHAVSTPPGVLAGMSWGTCICSDALGIIVWGLGWLCGSTQPYAPVLPNHTQHSLGFLMAGWAQPQQCCDLQHPTSWHMYRPTQTAAWIAVVELFWICTFFCMVHVSVHI
jgi:hypothetical protein